MAAPDLIECVPTSSFLIPSLSSPIASTASWRVLITFFDITWLNLPLICTAEICVSLFVVEYPQICCMIDAAKQTRQSVMSPDAICVTVSIFHPSSAIQKWLKHSLWILVHRNCVQGGVILWIIGCFEGWGFLFVIVLLQILWGIHKICRQRIFQVLQVQKLLLIIPRLFSFQVLRWLTFGWPFDALP